MFQDPFYQTNLGEIFVKTACMRHERATSEFFHSTLTMLGYTPDISGRIWTRDAHQTILVFADDFGVCRSDWDLDPESWFDPTTTVITDNHMPLPTQYRVFQLPKQYFGIYHYEPQDQQHRPQRRFNFSMNRMDQQRLLIMLEFASTQDFQDHWINFNGWDAYGPNQTQQDVQQNLEKYWNQLRENHAHYQGTVDQLLDMVPVRNHDMMVEQAHVSAWLTPIVETYAGDASQAFSEKIFRGLATPVPWTVYAARGSVAYLKNLGFDVLDDLVDHSYDQCWQNHSPGGIDKIKIWLECSSRTVDRLQKMAWDQVQRRCQQAAQHNQNLLKQWRQQYPACFAQWLPTVLEHLDQGR